MSFSGTTSLHHERSGRATPESQWRSNLWQLSKSRGLVYTDLWHETGNIYDRSRVIRRTHEGTNVVDWRGYHMTSPVDTLPWLCPRRHGTSQPVPATLSRRLTHINHTRFMVHGRPRSPDNQAKITYPVGVPEALALDGCHFCSARDSTSCFFGRQAQSPRISRFSWSQPTMLWRH